MKRKLQVALALFFILLATYQIGFLLWLNFNEAPFSVWNLDSLMLTVLLSFSVLSSGIYLLVKGARGG